MEELPPVLTYHGGERVSLMAERWLLGWEIVNWAGGIGILLLGCLVMFVVMQFWGNWVGVVMGILIMVMLGLVGALFFWAAQCHKCRIEIAAGNAAWAVRAMRLTWVVLSANLLYDAGIAGLTLYSVWRGAMREALREGLWMLPGLGLGAMLVATLLSLRRAGRVLRERG